VDIKYINSYTGQLETEQVFGEKSLRWLYEGSGRGLLPLIARPWLSKFYGWKMRQRGSQKLIANFVRRYGIDLSRFERKQPEDYTSFNDFFTRKLDPQYLIKGDTAVFPADGRHLGFQRAADIGDIWVKGQPFSLKTLLQSAALAEKYAGAALLLSRLCPLDYHRFHFPVSGKVGPTRCINGPLFSVNPIALRKNIRFLLENKRYLTEIETENFGPVMCVEIGATCVGSVIQTHDATSCLAGQEKGYFQFGGSSIITLFSKNITLPSPLLEATAKGYELFVRYGSQLKNSGQVIF